MRVFAFLILLLFANDCFSQGLSTLVSFRKKDRFINIPGTRVFMDQPTDFHLSSSFAGFQNSKKGTIQVYDLTGGNYFTNASTFTKATFKKKGAKVFEFREFTFHGYPAKFISMQGDPSVDAYSLIFGDSTFSVMVIASYPAGNRKVGARIKNAIMSCSYMEGYKTDPFRASVFSLDDSACRFKFSRASANVFFYSIAGSQTSANDPLVTVTPLPTEKNTTPAFISELMVESLQSYGFSNPEVVTASSKRINGYDAYESEIFGSIKNEKCVIYQLVVVKQNHAVVIQGLSKSAFRENVEEFKKLSYTVSLK